jgi:hypothetical protein
VSVGVSGCGREREREREREKTRDEAGEETLKDEDAHSEISQRAQSRWRADGGDVGGGKPG